MGLQTDDTHFSFLIIHKMLSLISNTRTMLLILMSAAWMLTNSMGQVLVSDLVLVFVTKGIYCKTPSHTVLHPKFK